MVAALLKADNRRKANWARLIQKVYEVDPLKRVNCGGSLRIIALIDDAGVVERILKHLSVWDPSPRPAHPPAPDSCRDDLGLPAIMAPPGGVRGGFTQITLTA